MRRILLLFALFLNAASAQETMMRQVYDPVTDTHVEVIALFNRPPPAGYLAVRVKIANNLKTDRSVRLDFESTSGYGEGPRTRTGFELAAPAGKAVLRDLLVPTCPIKNSYGGGGSNSVSVRLSGSLGEAGYQLNSSFQAKQPAVLLSEPIYTKNASSLDSDMATSLGTSSRGNVEFASKFDPKQLPDDWLAFSGYDSVVMGEDDWSDIPPGGRNAILSWVRLGGQLIIYSSPSTTPQSLGLPAEAGLGRIEFPSQGGFTTKGLVQRVMDNPVKPRQEAIMTDFEGTWPLQSYFGAKTFRYGMFVMVLVIFGILVGPVNLFVLAKSGQRHRLFITTPIISLGASVILIALIILQDGFGGSGVRLMLMEVRPDADINAAFVHQEQFCRTGVLTRSEFTVSPPSNLSPVPIAKSRWARFTTYGASGNFNLQPADGKQTATGDWFQSRSEHGHVLASVVSTRGRIEKTGQPDTFLSTFDHPLDTLLYQDPGGNWFRADGITSGKSFKMDPLEANFADVALAKEKALFSSRNARLFDNVAHRKGHFVAVTNTAPGIDTNPGIRWKETHAVITGPVMGNP